MTPIFFQEFSAPYAGMSSSSLLFQNENRLSSELGLLSRDEFPTPLPLPLLSNTPCASKHELSSNCNCIPLHSLSKTSPMSHPQLFHPIPPLANEVSEKEILNNKLDPFSSSTYSLADALEISSFFHPTPTPILTPTLTQNPTPKYLLSLATPPSTTCASLPLLIFSHLPSVCSSHDIEDYSQCSSPFSPSQFQLSISSSPSTTSFNSLSPQSSSSISSTSSTSTLVSSFSATNLPSSCSLSSISYVSSSFTPTSSSFSSTCSTSTITSTSSTSSSPSTFTFTNSFMNSPTFLSEDIPTSIPSPLLLSAPLAAGSPRYQLKILGVPLHGAKSRVETQIKLCLQLVTHPEGKKVDRFRKIWIPTSMLAACRWKKTLLAMFKSGTHDTTIPTSSLFMPDFENDPDKESALWLDGKVVCASDTATKVVICSSCIQREVRIPWV